MKEGKNRHTIWLTDNAWELVEERYQKDNCSTKNEYIEKAIRFYSGYLDSERSDEYLPRVMAQVLEGKLDAFGKRIGRQMFKQAVDENLMANLVAFYFEMDEDMPTSTAAIGNLIFTPTGVYRKGGFHGNFQKRKDRGRDRKGQGQNLRTAGPAEGAGTEKGGGGKQRDRGHRAGHEHPPCRAARGAPADPGRGHLGTKCPEVRNRG